jgi:hypothetical protein
MERKFRLSPFYTQPSPTTEDMTISKKCFPAAQIAAHTQMNCSFTTITVFLWRTHYTSADSARVKYATYQINPVSHRPMYVINYLHNNTIGTVSTFQMYLYITFHLPNIELVTITEQETTFFSRPPCTYFKSYKMCQDKFAYFSKICYHTPLSGPWSTWCLWHSLVRISKIPHAITDCGN